MIIYRCTNPACERYGLRTEKVCGAPIVRANVTWPCRPVAKKDYS